MVCNVQFSLCNMKFTGAFSGAGVVRNVQCAVCRVQCAEKIAFETG